MWKSTKVLAAVSIGLGILLGYAAGSGNMSLVRWAQAAAIAPGPTAEQPAGIAKCDAACCAGAKKGVLVALAHHNAEEEPEQPAAGLRPTPACRTWGSAA